MLLIVILFEQVMHDHPDAWPFKEPVDARDVPDYYDIIKDPMGKFHICLWEFCLVSGVSYLVKNCIFSDDVLADFMWLQLHARIFYLSLPV